MELTAERRRTDAKIYIENDAVTKNGAFTAQRGIEMDDGFLIVRTLRPDGSSLENATVKITGRGTELVYHTDSNGRTGKIPLPAPATKYSLSATSVVVPYTVYDVRAEYPGFYTNVYEGGTDFCKNHN